MKNIFQFFFISSFIFVFLLSSCEKKTKEETASEADSLRNVLLTIQDSLKVSWERMVADDDQKLADARRLLEEISYTNKYNVVQYDTLLENLSQLHQMRYSSSSMANSASIDAYDSASNKVINEIVALATTHPDYSRYPLMKELVDDIQGANGRVLRHRINYDYAVKSYNQFIEEHEEILEEVDTLDTLEKKPLFELES